MKKEAAKNRRTMRWTGTMYKKQISRSERKKKIYQKNEKKEEERYKSNPDKRAWNPRKQAYKPNRESEAAENTGSEKIGEETGRTRILTIPLGAG